MKKYTLGVDIGTTNLCVVLIENASYKVCRVVSKKNDTYIPLNDSSAYEQDAQKIIIFMFELFREMIAVSEVDVSEIEGIAITAQMHGVVLTDEHLELKSPLYTWRDRRSETGGALDRLRRKLPEDYESHSGCRLCAGYGGATLAWLFENEALSEKFQGCTAMTIADYLAALLTGCVATDYSHAASWGIFDIVNNCWYTDMVASLGIDLDILPDVLPGGSVVGKVLPERAEELNLAEDIKVWVPIGDNQASFYGATKAEQGVAVINLGTSGQITLPSETVCVEKGIETRPLPGGGYIYVGAILCGGWSYAYLASFYKDVLQKLGGIEIDNDLLYARMRKLMPSGFCTDLEVDNRFTGTRDGVGIQKGSIKNISEANLLTENLTYAFLRGIVQELADMVPDSENHSSWDVLRATGNAVRLNPVLLEIIADVFGVETEMAITTEEAASGAAFFAINCGE